MLLFPLLVQAIFVVLIAGVLLWGLKAAPFIDANIKQLIYVLVVVFAAIWLIYLFMGAFTTLPGRIR